MRTSSRDMRNPCTPNCPMRCPGCHCARREAWLFVKGLEKEEQKRERTLNAYQREAVRASRSKRLHRKRRI